MDIKNIKIPFTYIKSLLKKSNKLSDYPLHYYKNRNIGQADVQYRVRIINWTAMVGHGSNYENAFLKLNELFSAYSKNNKTVPFPWEKVPLSFASDKKILKYEKFAVEFIGNILEMDFYGGFYSDFSALTHFRSIEKNEDEKYKKEIIEKIEMRYGVDITEMYNENFPELFEYIINNRKDV